MSALKAAFDSLQQATGWLMQNGSGNPDNIGGVAVEYTRLFSLVAVGWAWLQAASTCRKALDQGAADAQFYENKLVVGTFFMQRYVSEHSSLLSKVTAGADNIMALSADAF